MRSNSFGVELWLASKRCLNESESARGEYHGSRKGCVAVADRSAIADHHFACSVLALIGCEFRLDDVWVSSADKSSVLLAFVAARFSTQPDFSMQRMKMSDAKH